MTTTRRRGPELESAILDAGWQQLVAEGYAGFTFEAIAARAKTGKAVLYRRWPDKEALLLAVLAQKGYGRASKTPDTGSLRNDVISLLRSANHYGDDIASLLSAILSAYFKETETTPAQLRMQLLGDRGSVMAKIVQRSIERGEIPGPLPARIVSVPFDLFRGELIMNLGRVPDATIVDIVDIVFLPLVTDPRRALPPQNKHETLRSEHKTSTKQPSEERR